MWINIKDTAIYTGIYIVGGYYRLFDTPPGISLINIMGLVLMTLDPLVLAGLGLMLLWLIGS